MQTAPLQSLAGVRVLITRPVAENRLLSAKLRALGAATVELPTIAILPPADKRLLDQSVRRLSEYDWVVFTSVHGVRFFSKRMAALGEPVRMLRRVKVAAIGPATAAALEKLCRKPDYVPGEFLSEQIAKGLGDVDGKRILLPRADIASGKLPALLRKRGAIVEEVVAYRTVIPDDLSWHRLHSILKEGVDVVAFTSPSTVQNLARVAGASRLEALLKGVKVACIGPVTAGATKALGVHVDIVAPNHTINDLVEAIVNEIRTV
jgi:uroporphyrinogen III methyltransferase/synthase